MAKGYNAPAEVRELEKQINDFTYRNGLDVRTVFQDLLRYIVHGFSLPDTPPLTDWRYNKEQTKVFYDMFATWIQIMSQQIERHGWYDAFGDLFPKRSATERPVLHTHAHHRPYVEDNYGQARIAVQNHFCVRPYGRQWPDAVGGQGRPTAKLSGCLGHRLHLLPDVRMQLFDKWLCGRSGLHRLTPDE